MKRNKAVSNAHWINFLSPVPLDELAKQFIASENSAGHHVQHNSLFLKRQERRVNSEYYLAIDRSSGIVAILTIGAGSRLKMLFTITANRLVGPIRRQLAQTELLNIERAQSAESLTRLLHVLVNHRVALISRCPVGGEPVAITKIVGDARRMKLVRLPFVIVTQEQHDLRYRTTKR
jgi:hypothetical protein